MSCNLVHHALGRRAYTQHRQAAGVDLRAARIRNDLCRDPQTPRLAHQLEHLVLALGLHRDLGLAVALPPLQELGCRTGRVLLAFLEQGLVACQGRVAALGCYLACVRSCQPSAVDRE